MRNSIFACQNPIESHWRLGRLPVETGTLTLIGWRVVPAPVDGGVPAEVGEILARAMTATGSVVFASSDVLQTRSDGWTAAGGDFVRELKDGNWLSRIQNVLPGAPPSVRLLSTRNAASAARLFDDAAFPWWLQGQAVLLAASERATPDIDKREYLALFEDDWSERAVRLSTIGVRGVLRAGVDGDVAGILTFEEDFKNALLKLIERETRAAGYDWAMLPESEFSANLAA